ncbi:MAG: ParA family protein [Gammaproteobacteria bacterium]|nr:MAG: ParA family protein [Gammaproteobacteria bacterium]
MTRIYAITNQKGGVGKTTTSINLAASLAATRRRVLLVDMDPQGNATMGSGLDKYELQTTSAELLLGQAEARAAIERLEHTGYDMIGANGDLTAAEVELMNQFGREFKLKRALEPVLPDYDFILIDCPPSLNMLTVNALVAAQGVIIPMQCEYYALEGLTALMQTIESIREAVNPELEIEGLLRTMYDPRNNLAQDVSGQLKEHFGDKVYNTIIPRNIRLAEAPSHGMAVIHYDKQSKGALAYLALAGEILRRQTRTAA